MPSGSRSPPPSSASPPRFFPHAPPRVFSPSKFCASNSKTRVPPPQNPWMKSRVAPTVSVTVFTRLVRPISIHDVLEFVQGEVVAKSGRKHQSDARRFEVTVLG